MNSAKDPVCGMTVLQEQAVPASYGHQVFYFCSDLCQRTFLTDPEKYLRPLEPAGIGRPRHSTCGVLHDGSVA